MARIMQRSFTSGEIAPALRSRADLSKYATGLALCLNMFPRAQGGCYSRPGMRFVGEVGLSSIIVRLIPFSFNTEQTYILVFQNLTMRVIRDGGFVLDGAGPALFELVTPYTTAQLSRLSFIQDADTMTICHPDHDPATITRTDHDAWSHDDIDFASQITVPSISAVATVGSGPGTFNKTYEYAITAVDEFGVESLLSTSSSITTPSLTETAGVKITWGSVSGADYYRVYKDTSLNVDVFGWIGDSENLEFSDFNIAPLTSDSPPVEREPFNGVDNKPAAVGYHSQRKIFCNTNNLPQTMFTTQIANDVSLRVSRTVKDTDAITIRISTNQVNEIRHAVSSDDLLLFTSGGVWRVTEDADGVFAPATAGVKIQTRAGANFVPPIIINSTVLYVQEKGARIRDLNYTFANNKYAGDDLSIMSEHLFEGRQILEMAFAEEPYGILWCIRDDGVLLGLTYQKEHEVWGWHQHTTNGTFESIAVIKEGNRDAVYVVVKRFIDGVNVRFVERIEEREILASEDCFYVDSGLSYDGSPATVISSLDHLEGELVAVLADGNVVEGLTVSSGSITLPIAASKVHVGLSYLPVMELLDIEQTDGSSTIKPSLLSVSKVMVEVEKSRGLFVGPKFDDGSTGTMYEVKPRLQGDDYDTLPLRDFKEEVIIQPGWNRGGGIRIEQRDPLPLAVLSVSPEVIIGGN